MSEKLHLARKYHSYCDNHSVYVPMDYNRDRWDPVQQAYRVFSLANHPIQSDNEQNRRETSSRFSSKDFENQQNYSVVSWIFLRNLSWSQSQQHHLPLVTRIALT